jgi:(p)ppGpp synthase/HD superfamily hydrolase
MQELTQLLTNLATYDNSEDRILVTKAAQSAEMCHRGFFRLDKTPYIFHPIAVATILSEWKAPPPILAAALLHDIHKRRCSHVPSTATLEAEFPSSLLSLVQDVASLGELGPSLIQKPVEVSVEQDQETDRGGSQRFLWANVILQQDPIAVVIKLADRLHNIQSHDLLPDEIAHQEREKWFAAAILNIFAPLADRMGMRDVKERLEDGAFYIYNREQYAKIDAYSREVLRDMPIDQQISNIEQILQDYNIKARVFKHLEHRYAICRRQLRSANREVAPADTFSIFVVVKSIEDCYLTLGVLHSVWRTLNEVYDTLAAPKLNGYRVLRMRAFEPSIGAFNVVIQTEEMYLVAVHGITAGWQGVREELLPKIEPLPERPIGHIMTITPKGDVIYLPRGATAIDFAYARHEEVGHRLMQAWVNGNRVPLKDPLEDGSVVDIITSRGVGKPSLEWLQYVVTPAAREAIERWTQQEIISELVVEGTDRIRLLGDVIDCISMKSINMLHLHAEVIGGKAIIRTRMQGISTTVLEELEREIKGLPHVTHARWEKFSEAPSQAYPYAITRAQSNPYSYSSPALGDDFKGRKREVQEVVDRLRGDDRSNALLIWGQQRIGKTSLLLHLEKDVLPNEKYLIVYITLQDVEGQPIGNFLHKIALEIQSKLQREEVRVPHLDKMKQDPVRHFQELMGQLEQMFGPQNLLIILDEFQGISTLKEEGVTKQEVFSYFRSLVQHGMLVNFLLCGGGIHNHLLAQSEILSFLALTDSIKVGNLDKKAAVALVTELDRSLHYDDQAVERLLEVTDCHPCYLTFLCKELYQSRTRQSITLADVKRVIGQIVDWPPKLETTVNHFWFMGLQSPELAKKHKHILSAIAGGADSSRWMTFDKIAERTHPEITDEELPKLLTNLKDYGSIDRNGSNYRVHMPLLELWLREVQF